MAVIGKIYGYKAHPKVSRVSSPAQRYPVIVTEAGEERR